MEGPNIKNWKVLLEESMFASKNHDRAVLRAIWGLRHPMSFLSISPLTKSRKTNMNKRHMYIPGTQMTLVWLEKMLKHLRQFSWDWSLSKKATHTNLLNPLCFCFKLTYIYMYNYMLCILLFLCFRSSFRTICCFTMFFPCVSQRSLGIVVEMFSQETILRTTPWGSLWRWWLQPIWKICSSNWIIFSPLTMNIKKNISKRPSRISIYIRCCVNTGKPKVK